MSPVPLAPNGASAPQSANDSEVEHALAASTTGIPEVAAQPSSTPSANGTAHVNGSSQTQSSGQGLSQGAFQTQSRGPVTIPTASLHNKVALITGASRGIGRGCALELARRGASVVVNYGNSEDAAQDTVREIETIGKSTGARAVAIKADVSKVPEIDRLFKETMSKLGRIDIVFSNSGAECWDKTEEVTEEKYDRIFNLNARAQFFVGQAAIRYLQDNGRLVLMSSIAAGLLGVKNHALYSASKMAVKGMVTSFATDFGRRGITCNAVAPGGIKSDMFASNAWHYIPGGTPEWSAEKIEGLMAAHCPLGRCAVPEDVARVVAFLSSDDGGWINGQTITVSGGSGQ